MKAVVLDDRGVLHREPTRFPTPHPCSPETLVQLIARAAASLSEFERVSVGFPGVVREGYVLTAPHLDDDRWSGFPLASVLAQRLEKPVRVRNDSEVHGLGVISGWGLEMVVTLGTGVGTSLFENGRPAPHLELAHHPLRGGRTYDEYLGLDAWRRIGRRKWSARVGWTIGVLYTLVRYDVLYLGDGNAAKLDVNLPANVVLIPNAAGLLGGVRLWQSSVPPATDVAAAQPSAGSSARFTARRAASRRGPAPPNPRPPSRRPGAASTETAP